MNELKTKEDNYRRTLGDTQKTAEELKREQDHAANIERQRKEVENKVKV